jgi:hypothetical protein
VPAAGAMAKPPSPPHRAELPSPLNRTALPSPLDHADLPSPLDCAGLPSPLDLDPVRDALLRRIEPVAAAWAAQDAELDAEIAALERAGVFTVPAAEEWPGPAVDSDSAPPDGRQAWLADLPGPLLDEYLAATAEAAPEVPRAGLGGRVTREGAAFAADGVADLLRPGPALAGLAEGARAAGLSRLTDDELAGVIRAGRRLSSWASALELAAVGDLMRRREGEEAAGHQHAAEHVDAEIAALLTLTGRGAGRVLDLAIALRRLPLTVQALAAGAIDLPRVAVIADEMTGLDDDHAAEVERHILVRAPRQTTSQVRALARRAVLATDPRAARKRQEQAQREARVERWNEHAGTAALAGRDLPPAAVIAADQHISALARGLRAAGLAGTADQLRAQVFLALLSGAPAASLLPTDQHQPDPAASGPGTAPATSATASGPGTAPATSAATSGPGTAPATSATTTGLGAATPSASATADWPGVPPVAGMVNLTMPLSTWLGLLEVPSEVTGFGPLTADDSRHLATAMAEHPQTRWCVTLTSGDGSPVAHGCARPGRGLPGPPPSPRPATPQGPARPARKPAPPKRTPEPPGQRSTLARHASAPQPGGEASVAAWLASIPMKWFESPGCAHQRQSTAYRPPAALQHLIRVRQQTCAFPGCRRPASQCDLDHTTPFQRGGLTCECNLAPLCRAHHQTKQAPGWHLRQLRPGIMAWTTPSGRTYTKGPTVYPA